MKKTISLILVIICVLSITVVFSLSGCKTAAEETVAEETVAEETVAEETEAGETAAEETEAVEVLPAMDFNVWDWQPGENYIAAMAENIELFKEMNPQYANVNIIHTTHGQDYWNVLRASLFAGDIPDCFGVLQGEVDLLDFMMDLRPYISADEEWMAQYAYIDAPDTGTNGKDDRVTGIAIDRWVAGIYYYKDMLEQYGFDVPVTVDDYIAMEPVLAEDGIEVLAMGGDVWVLAHWYWTMTQGLTEITNPAGIVKDFYFGDLKFTDPIWKTSMEAYKKLYDGGVFREDELQLGQFAEAVQNFQGRKSWGFWMGGTWWAGSMNPEDVAADNIGIIPIPIAPGGTPTVPASVGQTYGLNKDLAEEKVQVGLDFLKFLSSPAAAEVYLRNNMLPTATIPEGMEITNSLIKASLELGSQVQSFDVHAWEGVSMQLTGDKLTNVFLGIDTVDEAIAELQALQDKWLSEME